MWNEVRPILGVLVDENSDQASQEGIRFDEEGLVAQVERPEPLAAYLLDIRLVGA